MITTVTCGKCGLTNNFDSRDFKDYYVTSKKRGKVQGLPYTIHCGICGVRCEQTTRYS